MCIRRHCNAAFFAALWAAASLAAAADKPPPKRPAGDDYTAASLKEYQQALLACYGGTSRNVPLDVKAEYYEWALARYHLTDYDQVHTRIDLPKKKGERPHYHYGADNSTWNGALLAALSHKYAVTKDAETLKLICRLLDGLHLFQQATGQRGLPARCLMRRDTPFHKADRRFTSREGTVYHYYGDPAKGTVNQIMAGYVALMMHVGDDLPDDYRRRAQEDMTAIVLHLVGHDYHLTEKDGRRTTYGNLTPRFGAIGLPFNAQVAYMIVAAGTYFPPADPAQRDVILRQFKKLRKEHHVYYEDPLYNFICPQKVAASGFIKGMNDRNHVINAAYYGLAMEIDSARRQRREPDREFLYQLGRTMYWGLSAIEHDHNALCNFMWAGLLTDRRVLKAVVPSGRERKRVRRQVAYVVSTGLEQLRRFPIDRFYYPGREIETRRAQWADVRERHNSYLWKSDGRSIWKITAPAGETHIASIDYLYAYWLMRHHGLGPRR